MLLEANGAAFCTLVRFCDMVRRLVFTPDSTGSSVDYFSFFQSKGRERKCLVSLRLDCFDPTVSEMCHISLWGVLF